MSYRAGERCRRFMTQELGCMNHKIIPENFTDKREMAHFAKYFAAATQLRGEIDLASLWDRLIMNALSRRKPSLMQRHATGEKSGAIGSPLIGCSAHGMVWQLQAWNRFAGGSPLRGALPLRLSPQRFVPGSRGFDPGNFLPGPKQIASAGATGNVPNPGSSRSCATRICTGCVRASSKSKCRWTASGSWRSERRMTSPKWIPRSCNWP